MFLNTAVLFHTQQQHSFQYGGVLSHSTTDSFLIKDRVGAYPEAEHRDEKIFLLCLLPSFNSTLFIQIQLIERLH